MHEVLHLAWAIWTTRRPLAKDYYPRGDEEQAGDPRRSAEPARLLDQLGVLPELPGTRLRHHGGGLHWHLRTGTSAEQNGNGDDRDLHAR